MLIVPSDRVVADDFRFADMWLTPDQQGMQLFEAGEYANAARRFEDPRWRATALYMNEEFDAAAYCVPSPAAASARLRAWTWF